MHRSRLQLKISACPIPGGLRFSASGIDVHHQTPLATHRTLRDKHRFAWPLLHRLPHRPLFADHPNRKHVLRNQTGFVRRLYRRQSQPLAACCHRSAPLSGCGFHASPWQRDTSYRFVFAPNQLTSGPLPLCGPDANAC